MEKKLLTKAPGIYNKLGEKESLPSSQSRLPVRISRIQKNESGSVSISVAKSSASKLPVRKKDVLSGTKIMSSNEIHTHKALLGFGFKSSDLKQREIASCGNMKFGSESSGVVGISDISCPLELEVSKPDIKSKIKLNSEMKIPVIQKSKTTSPESMISNRVLGISDISSPNFETSEEDDEKEELEIKLESLQIPAEKKPENDPAESDIMNLSEIENQQIMSEDEKQESEIKPESLQILEEKKPENYHVQSDTVNVSEIQNQIICDAEILTLLEKVSNFEPIGFPTFDGNETTISSCRQEIEGIIFGKDTCVLNNIGGRLVNFSTEFTPIPTIELTKTEFLFSYEDLIKIETKSKCDLEDRVNECIHDTEISISDEGENKYLDKVEHEINESIKEHPIETKSSESDNSHICNNYEEIVVVSEKHTKNDPSQYEIVNVSGTENHEMISDDEIYLLLEKVQHFEPVEFLRFDGSVLNICGEEIKEIVSELGRVVANTIQTLKDGGQGDGFLDRFLTYVITIPTIEFVNAELIFLVEDLANIETSSPNDLEYLTNECADEIQSLISNKDKNQNVENVEHEINECIQELSIVYPSSPDVCKTNISFDLFTDLSGEEVRDDFKIETSENLDVQETLSLTSNNIDLSNGNGYSPLNKLDSPSYIIFRDDSYEFDTSEIFPEVLISNKLNNQDSDALIGNLIRSVQERQKITNGKLLEKDSLVETFEVISDTVTVETQNNEHELLTTQRFDSSFISTETNEALAECEFIIVNPESVVTDSGEDSSSDGLELVELANEIGSIKNYLETLQSQLQSESGNLTEAIVLEETENVHVYAICGKEDQIETSSSLDKEDVGQHEIQNQDAHSCSKDVDSESKYQNEIIIASSSSINILTSEFMKVVKTDMIKSDQPIQGKESESTDTKTDEERYQLLKLLNTLQDFAYSSENAQTEQKSGRIKLLPEILSSPEICCCNLDENEKKSSQLVEVLKALDDFSNEKLEDIVDTNTKVCTTISEEETSPAADLSNKACVPSEILEPEKPSFLSTTSASRIVKPKKSDMSINKDIKKVSSCKLVTEIQARGTEFVKVQPNRKSKNLPTKVKSSDEFSGNKKMSQTKLSPSTSEVGSQKKVVIEKSSKCKPNTDSSKPAVQNSSSQDMQIMDSKMLLVIHKKETLKEATDNPAPTKSDKYPSREDLSILKNGLAQVKAGNSSSSQLGDSIRSNDSVQNQINSCSSPRDSSPSSEVEIPPSRGWCILNIPIVSDKILNFLDTRSLKNGRLICQDWAEAINNSSIFWKIMKVFKPMDFQVSWEEFESADLFQRFSCPNIHILRCDLREQNAVGFFERNGSELKYLTLDQCILSVFTLQSLLMKCRNLKHFEIIGFPRCIFYSESIFHNGVCPEYFTHLQKLILNSDPGSYSYRVENFMTDVLNQGIISDFLVTAKSLEAIQLIGWKSCSCMSVLRVLNSNSNRTLQHVNQIKFSQIPIDNLNFDHFILLALNAVNSHIKLRILELSLAEPQREYNRGRDYANLILREIVRTYSQTLEELVLDNCPLTEEVFIFRMPNLKKLSLHQTNISNTEFQLLMPKLKSLNCTINQHHHVSPGIQVPILTQIYHGNDAFSKFSYIYLIAIICAVLGYVVYTLHPESAGITLFLMTMTLFLLFNFNMGLSE